MSNSLLRYFFVALLLVGVAQTELYGQSTLGVTWDIPGDADSVETQLRQFHKLGISVLEVDRSPASEVWNQIDSLGFTVYGNLNINFPVTHTFAQPDSSLIKQIEKGASNYLSQSSVKAIGLFNYGNTKSPVFWKAAAPFAKKIKQAKNIALYHKSSSAGQTDSSVVSFSIVNMPITPNNVRSIPISPKTDSSYRYYAPSDELKPFLKPFKNFITAVNQPVENTLFVDSEWLLRMIEKHPQFQETIQSLTSKSEPVFPLPNENMPPPDNKALPMILLLLIWGTVALHYNISPLYRKSLFRYFTAHKFFVDDIFKRLIRSPIPAVVIILQNALLLSISSYAIFSLFLSSLGQQAFFHHFPGLAILGNNSISILACTFVLVMLLSLLSTLWLYFSHKKIKSLTQIATIFAWPLQLNFLFCTGVITCYAASASGSAFFFSILALCLFLLSYCFSALDISRYIRSKTKYLFKTIITYTIIIAGLIVWLITYDPWMDALALALNLT